MHLFTWNYYVNIYIRNFKIYAQHIFIHVNVCVVLVCKQIIEVKNCLCRFKSQVSECLFYKHIFVIILQLKSKLYDAYMLAFPKLLFIHLSHQLNQLTSWESCLCSASVSICHTKILAILKLNPYFPYSMHAYPYFLSAGFLFEL